MGRTPISEKPLQPLSSGRASRVIRTLTLLACTGVVGCSRSVSSTESAAVDGSALFAQACAKCHGADGRGGLAMAANGPRPIDLTSQEWHRARSDQEIVVAIRSGRGAMPPFGDVLTPEQIDALGAYVRRLKRP